MPHQNPRIWSHQKKTAAAHEDSCHRWIRTALQEQQSSSRIEPPRHVQPLAVNCDSGRTNVKLITPHVIHVIAYSLLSKACIAHESRQNEPEKSFTYPRNTDVKHVAACILNLWTCVKKTAVAHVYQYKDLCATCRNLHKTWVQLCRKHTHSSIEPHLPMHNKVSKHNSRHFDDRWN